MSEKMKDIIVLDAAAISGESWLLELVGDEALSQPYRFKLQLSTEGPVTPDVLGTTMCLPLKRFVPEDTGKPDRYFHGYITQLTDRSQFFRPGPRKNRVYEVELRPWLWMLSRRANCRVFQELTVPDIVEKIFADYGGLADYQFQLNGTYQKRDYCVQYRETDLAFVSRLLEQEGIYYYFQHERTAHKLILVDDMASHTTLEGFSSEDYVYSMMVGGEFRIHRWNPVQQVRTDRYALKDYDFENPTLRLEAKQSGPKYGQQPSLELYDHPGGYRNADEGERYVRIRMEEEQAAYQIVEGKGATRGLATGFTFTLTRQGSGTPQHPLLGDNTLHLVCSAHYDYSVFDLSEEQALTSAAAGSEAGKAVRPTRNFTCTFTAMQTTTQFRPARSTPRPVIAGLQSARVVGPEGQEIWTDEYGRVKVQFAWDRLGTFDDASSCWIRVAQIWAGAGWGGLYTPRIDQEVMVSFLEGDPDQPVVVGCVYNAVNAPPGLRKNILLPDRPHVSGVKTNSLHNSGGYNELSFDDKDGDELILLRAEKDLRGTASESMELSAKTMDMAAKLMSSVSAGLQLSLSSKGQVAIEAGPLGAVSITLSPLGTITLQGAVEIVGLLTLSAPPVIKPPTPKVPPIKAKL